MQYTSTPVATAKPLKFEPFATRWNQNGGRFLGTHSNKKTIDGPQNGGRLATPVLNPDFVFFRDLAILRPS